MFIPLTINERSPGPAGEGLRNVLIVGDTAGIFYMLSHIVGQHVNVFIADTGIRRPLRELPCHRNSSKDRANVYYDFVDGRLGAGVIRRMDFIITCNYDIREWPRSMHIPAAHLWQNGTGTWIAFEGLIPDGTSVTELLTNLVTSDPKKYRLGTVGRSSKVCIQADKLTWHPSNETWNSKPIEVKESTFSAWDRFEDVLTKDESMSHYMLSWDRQDVGKLTRDKRILDAGIPELDIVCISGDGKPWHYVELTGDFNRVFAGCL